MFCMKCGKEIPDAAQFCPYCGAKKEMLSVSAVKPVEQSDLKAEIKQNNSVQNNILFGLGKDALISLGLMAVSALLWITRWIYVDEAGSFSIFSWGPWAREKWAYCEQLMEIWRENEWNGAHSLPKQLDMPSWWFVLAIVFIGVGILKILIDKKGASGWCGGALIIQILTALYFIISLNIEGLSGSVGIACYLSIALLIIEKIHLAKYVPKDTQ